VGQSHFHIKYGRGILFPRVDRPRCEADQSPPPSVKLKNEWSYTFIYTYALWCHAEDFGLICIVKELTDNFYCFGYIPWLWIFGLKLAAIVRVVVWHSDDRASWYILTINQWDALISQIYFWNRTLHVSDGFSVHHQESSTVHTAIHTGYGDCLLELYMFRTGFLSIIRSLVLYTQQYIQVMVTAS